MMPDKPPLKVLIADDSILIRARLSEMIAELDTIQLVGQVIDTPAALGAIRELKPDVVILDIYMPGGSGLQALKTIKALVPPPIVIMFTGHPEDQLKAACLEAGAEHFFDKAREFTAVMQVLERLAGAVVALETRL